MYETKKDSVACGAVLAAMMLTVLCGAFTVQVQADAASPEATLVVVAADE